VFSSNLAGFLAAYYAGAMAGSILKGARFDWPVYLTAFTFIAMLIVFFLKVRFAFYVSLLIFATSITLNLLFL
jgi:hypothetical protein